jgi:hypothetical protein
MTTRITESAKALWILCRDYGIIPTTRDINHVDELANGDNSAEVIAYFVSIEHFSLAISQS